MHHHRTRGAHRLGLAATTALAVAFATTGPAAATGPAVSSSIADDTLTVTGTSHSDRLTLRLAPGDPDTLQVDFGDDGVADQRFSRSKFSRIDVFLRSGDDQLRIDQGNGAFADEALTVFAGSGDDTILGGDANELVFAGSGNDIVDGNRGVDTALLGPGNDRFIWDPGDGSDVLDGDNGTDTLLFNGANVNEAMRLSADRNRAVFLRDPGAVRMDMNRVEVIDVVALAGADTITVDDTSATAIRRTNIELSAGGVGDGQPDVVTVNGTDGADSIDVRADGGVVDVGGVSAGVRISGGETIDGLQINGRGGNDTADVDAAVNALIGVRVDLGAGQD